ncbi:MAG: glycosyltransferase family 2 protein [Parasphingorhabdus sp.]|uniref:glycosyltransferase family 2 protein n=1 Tax=Parasphingorhabdus sp. TaxID=2709688 RepID=UPI003299CAD5
MNSVEITMTALAWLFVGPFLILFGIYLIEVLIALLLGRKDPGQVEQTKFSSPKIAILIPAHNETSIIDETIKTLKSRIPENAQILVVADNCSDDTAVLARAAGADVVERSSSTDRGKGFALAHGRDILAATPPDVVIILDADCMLDKHSAQKLAFAAQSLGAPVQATNLIHSPAGAPPMVQISNFAMLMKNLIRQRGMTRMGGAALLTGTGMAFPWPVFAKAPLASGDLAEDLSLGVSLTKSGQTPLFVESAGVTSLAAAKEDTLVQRTRWEHGFLSTAKAQALPLIGSGLLPWSKAQFFLGLHLLVPPLALLFASGLVVILLSGLLKFWGASPLPFQIISTIVFLSILTTLAAWIIAGRSVLSFGALARIPLYILWKIPVYLKLFKGKETQWIRTRRSGENQSSVSNPKK